MPETRVWFITGASTGFGRVMTERLLSKGHTVVATLRKPEVLAELVSQYPSSRLLVVKVDVAKSEEVSAAFAKARDVFGRIDIVFNNAGRMINGEVESMREEDAREMMETNFFGVTYVTREAVKFFREVNNPSGGRLLQMSSGMGISSFATYGYYSASKFAVEGFNAALVQELDPNWNIKVLIFDVGPFATNLWTTNKTLAPVHKAYTNPELGGHQSRAHIESPAPANGDPEKACAVFEKVAEMDDPPPRLLLHDLVLQLATGKANELLEAVEKCKSWSEDVYL